MNADFSVGSFYFRSDAAWPSCRSLSMLRRVLVMFLNPWSFFLLRAKFADFFKNAWKSEITSL